MSIEMQQIAYADGSQVGSLNKYNSPESLTTPAQQESHIDLGIFQRADIVCVPPRGAAKEIISMKGSDGETTLIEVFKNPMMGDREHTPLGGGRLNGGVRPRAVEALISNGFLPETTPILITSGSHPDGFVYHDLIRDDLKERGIANPIIVNPKSIDSTGENGILLEHLSKEHSLKSAVLLVDRTQVIRMDMISALYKAAHGENSPQAKEEAKTVENKLIQHDALSYFSDEEKFKALWEDAQKKQKEENMSEAACESEFRRFLLVKKVAENPQAFFEGMAEDMPTLAQSYFDNHTRKYGIDWREVVTPEVLQSLEENGKQVQTVCVEDVFKTLGGSLGRYEKMLSKSFDNYRTLANEFAGAIQMRLLIYNTSANAQKEMIEEFLKCKNVSVFVEQNTLAYKETLESLA